MDDFWICVQIGQRYRVDSFETELRYTADELKQICGTNTQNNLHICIIIEKLSIPYCVDIF